MSSQVLREQSPAVRSFAALLRAYGRLTRELNAQLLMNRLIGSATATGIKAGTDPTDIGAGIVQAPQN